MLLLVLPNGAGGNPVPVPPPFAGDCCICIGERLPGAPGGCCCCCPVTLEPVAFFWLLFTITVLVFGGAEDTPPSVATNLANVPPVAAVAADAVADCTLLPARFVPPPCGTADLLLLLLPVGTFFFIDDCIPNADETPTPPLALEEPETADVCRFDSFP